MARDAESVFDFEQFDPDVALRGRVTQWVNSELDRMKDISTSALRMEVKTKKQLVFDDAAMQVSRKRL